MDSLGGPGLRESGPGGSGRGPRRRAGDRRAAERRRPGQRRLRGRPQPERVPGRARGRQGDRLVAGRRPSTWTNTWASTADHPASFRRYLQEHLFRLVGLGPDRLRLIPGEQADRPLRTCLDYEDLLHAEPTDIVCAGIGENGHLAFNDPPVADFLDPVLVKVVRLDAACRSQQLNDGCFERIEDVPTHAYTLTIPALLRAPVVSVIVPGPRKANAVLNTLRGPIGEACPATALRRHPGARLYLDRDAARLVL